MDSRLEQLIALRKLQGHYQLPSEETPYHPTGVGASPQTALRLEALGNRFVYPGKFESLMQQGVYPVRPEFVGQDWKGSGSYMYGGPNEGAILLNTNNPWNYGSDGTEEIIAHELRHKQAGSMGGIKEWRNPNTEYTQKMDKRIRNAEDEEWRVPGERYAYGGNEVLGEDMRYYLPGDLQRILAGRRLGGRTN